jgi:MoxR-like ATPase
MSAATSSIHPSDACFKEAAHELNEIISLLSGLILGKENEIRLSLAAFLAQGHILIEDLPGMGKTTLASALAKVFDMPLKRVQLTSDLLPADLLGVHILDPATGVFKFKPGPVFTPLLLADEINRSTPKTQSALLEAMAERQITIDGKTYALPKPFLVMATQNPSAQLGTFQLPESQLDRFLIRLSMGYPDSHEEKKLLLGQKKPTLEIKSMKPLHSLDKLFQWMDLTSNIQVSMPVAEYAWRLLNRTRHHQLVSCGLSTRAGLGLIGLAKACALIEGRSFVLPEDIQKVFVVLAAHRLVVKPSQSATDVASQILSEVDAVFNT